MKLTIIILSIVIIYQWISKRRIKKDFNHQRSLVIVLRSRLGNKQDNSQLFTMNELKEISEWSDKKLQRRILYKQKNKLPDFEYDIDPPSDIISNRACSLFKAKEGFCNCKECQILSKKMRE